MFIAIKLRQKIKCCNKRLLLSNNNGENVSKVSSPLFLPIAKPWSTNQLGECKTAGRKEKIWRNFGATRVVASLQSRISRYRTFVSKFQIVFKNWIHRLIEKFTLRHFLLNFYKYVYLVIFQSWIIHTVQILITIKSFIEWKFLPICIENFKFKIEIFKLCFVFKNITLRMLQKASPTLSTSPITLLVM